MLIMTDKRHIQQLYFYQVNILYLTRISVRSSSFELAAVRIFKLKSQKVYLDGQTDIKVGIYSCTFMN